MKAILLIALAAGATLLTGCETTAVVERPVYGGARVYYASGRPYYYTGGVRSWGYPRGYYGGYRSYGHRDYRHHDYDDRPRYAYSRNVRTTRNTYIVNNRTVVNNRSVSTRRDRDIRFQDRGRTIRSREFGPRTKVKNPPPGQVKKHKRNRA